MVIIFYFPFLDPFCDQQKDWWAGIDKGATERPRTFLVVVLESKLSEGRGKAGCMWCYLADMCRLQTIYLAAD